MLERGFGLASDVAYCYLGGALNQRLGHALLDADACERLVAVRYPVIGAVPSVRLAAGSDITLYVYSRRAGGGLIEWDAPASLVTMPHNTAYLLGRAIRVTQKASLTVSYRVLRPGAAGIRNVEFGLAPARAGVPIVCDMLLDSAPNMGCGDLTVIEVIVCANDVPLTPSHLLLIKAALPGTKPQESIIEDWDGLSRLLAT